MQRHTLDDPMTYWAGNRRAVAASRQGPRMSATATCPRCATQFDGRKALLGGGVSAFYSPFTRRNVALRVRCPWCRHEFATTDVRLFGGRLSLNGYRLVAAGLLVACVLVAIYLPAR